MAEGEDDEKAESQGQQQRTEAVAEAGGQALDLEPGLSQWHVQQDGLHLDVGAEDAAHVEELMAVTYERRNTSPK